VSVQWLAPRLSRVQVVEATWFLPAIHGARNAQAEFLQSRIPGAVAFDLDQLSDPNETELPHMLAPPDWFKSRMEDLGLFSDLPLVVYDRIGQFSAPRAWWNLKLYGAAHILLLDGGLPQWLKAGMPFATGPVPTPEKKGKWMLPSSASIQRGVKHLEQVEQFVKDGGQPGVVLLDARASGRFNGVDPEPRPGLRPGHIPHSLSLPFGELLNPDATFKSDKDLTDAFTRAGVFAGNSRPKEVICTCGSGTTAGILSFALQNFFDMEALVAFYMRCVCSCFFVAAGEVFV